MRKKDLTEILFAEISYFAFILLGIYAGYRFWSITAFAQMGKDSIFGGIFSLAMLCIFILAIIPVFLLSLRRMLFKTGILTKEESKKFISSRTWFLDK